MRILIVLLMGLTLVLAACGGPGDNAGDMATPTEVVVDEGGATATDTPEAAVEDTSGTDVMTDTEGMT
ncbi:MAG: hypothetical protein KDE58_31885, partial [Caldilineaceae bacterium]|nr:hypothetical protein [Caldilineaceae bacterium]